MLRDLQGRMAASLLADYKAPPPADLVAGDAARAAARFMIHRGNVVESLANALALTYPAVRAIAGERNFRVLAVAQVRAAPPRRPELMAYGGDFPAFVAGHAAAIGDFPFLADLARLEWAMNESFYADDAPALAPETLAAVPPERLPALRLALLPATRLVASDRHPIHTIWTDAVAGTAQPEPLASNREWPARGEAVLVARQARAVEAFKLEAGEAVFLTAMDAGTPLEPALAEAAAAAPGFDLSATLAAALTRRVFGATVTFEGENS